MGHPNSCLHSFADLSALYINTVTHSRYDYSADPHRTLQNLLKHSPPSGLRTAPTSLSLAACPTLAGAALTPLLSPYSLRSRKLLVSILL